MLGTVVAIVVGAHVALLRLVRGVRAVVVVVVVVAAVVVAAGVALLHALILGVAHLIRVVITTTTRSTKHPPTPLLPKPCSLLQDVPHPPPFPQRLLFFFLLPRLLRAKCPCARECRPQTPPPLLPFTVLPLLLFLLILLLPRLHRPPSPPRHVIVSCTWPLTIPLP